ncbi:MAG: 5'/3'-nucleotidase SurE [Elusimicrobia bacterium]|nr:5'/3'-nucleotidase SurE [Elusimicrobiota bacterium]
MSSRILVVNDDGVYGPGLRPLISAMRKVGSVLAVVPDQERSADSHSLTLHKPIRVQKTGKDLYILNGRPADCVRLGLLELMGMKADLVVSGINRGYNLGEDVIYSGTVAAAREAALLGLPAIAFSQDPDSGVYGPAASFASRLARVVLKKGLPPGICLNVNSPLPSRGKLAPVELARLGRRIYSKEITRRSDPRGGHYYWLAGRAVSGVRQKGTDIAAVASGRIAITPLHIDSTDFEMLEALKSWEIAPS